MIRPIVVKLVACFIILACACPRPAGGQPVTTVRIANGLAGPSAITAPPGDTARLFVARLAGVIRIIDLTADPPALVTTPFLDIDPLVNTGGEQGLLGLAFDPDYANNGYLYVNYNANNGSNTIARYTVSDDPNIANPDSGLVLKTMMHPVSVHNGGCIQFGPDGYLYASQGDAGPSANAQNPGTLLGKLLRLDVHNPPDYIPIDNPFVGPGDPLDEIWALGLRNPWRFSFDRQTGDLYLGDVGAASREEINFTPAGGAGGQNYGWNCYQGSLPQLHNGCLPEENYQFPIHDYPHGMATGGGCAVMGGFVYRGSAICWLQGTYVFGDYCYQRIWSFRVVDGAVTEFEQRNAQWAPPAGQSITSITTFGEDAAGELYIGDLSNGGEIFKVVPSAASLDIMAADPQANTVDAREDLTAGTPAGLSGFTVHLADSNGGYCTDEIAVDCSGPAPCPTVTAVTGQGEGAFVIELSGPIPPGYCTRFTFANTSPGPANPLVYRFLPGDSNADGTSNVQDLLALVQALNAGSPSLAAHDINRNGVINTQDLLRLVQLLNGVGATQAWNGVSIVCP